MPAPTKCLFLTPLRAEAEYRALLVKAGLRPTRRDCLRCHRAEGVSPARFADDAPMQLDCGSCHKPHAKTAGEERVACTTCHRQVARAGLHALPAHGRCGDCHLAHLWRTEEKACLGCHARAPVHARQRACAACHGFAGAGQPALPRSP